MALLNILTCLSCLSFVTLVDGQPSHIHPVLTLEPTDVQIERETEINLQCVFDQPTNNCYWLKDGTAQTTVEFIGNKDNGNCSIRLIGNDEAQGNWQCGIPDSGTTNGVLSREAKVTIIGATKRLKAPSRQDVFVQQPEDTTVRSGDNTILKCIFKTDMGIVFEDCYWEMEGGSPISIGGRYSLDGDRQRGDCSITITNANLQLDDGIWFCGIKQTGSSKAVTSNKANLTVAVAPKDPKILQDQIEQPSGSNLGVQFGQTMTVTCTAQNGNPGATLTWSILGSELAGNVRITPSMSDKRVTVVNDLTTPVLQDWKDQELTCTSSHPSYDAGQERRTSVFLKELQKTSTASIICQNSTDSKRTITLKANEKGEFTCNGDGLPLPEYRWQVKKDKKWEKLMNNVQNLTVFSTSQEIRCIASNDNYKSYASSQSWTIIGTDASGTNSVSSTQLVAIILSIWVAKYILN